MVSAGTVQASSSELKQMMSKYISQLEDLSSAWKGASHDSIVSQGSNFNSETQSINSQFSSFAEAVTLYTEYKEAKDKYKSYQSQISSSNDEATNSNYRSLASECERKMNELSPKIKAALQSASSYKMTATSLTGNATDTGAASTTTDTSTQATPTTSTTGGKFVALDKKGVYGYIVSAMDGKQHTVFNQSQISGWGSMCNRAAAASIASGFTDDNNAVAAAKKASGGIGYNNKATNGYFNQFGLSANVRDINGSYDKVKNDIVTNLSQGNYIMFDLSQPNVKGQSGQKWTSTRHWLSLLDIKKTNTGSGYAVFVSDSGHRGSTKDYGLGAGWYDLNEFSGQKIAHFTTISNTRKTT